jgi:hypothetical protein
MELSKAFKEIMEYSDKEYSKRLIKINEEVNRKKQYIGSYNQRIRDKIKNASINVIKMNPEKYEEMQRKYYLNFYQVKNNEGHIERTYTLDAWNGICVRYKYMKSTSSLYNEDLMNFVNDKDIVNAFNKLTGFPDFIDDLREVLSKCRTKVFNTNFSFDVEIPATEEEKSIFTKTDKIIYDIEKNNIKDSNGKSYSSYDNTEIANLFGKYLLDKYETEVIKKANKILKEITIEENKCKQHTETIDENLAKWLMIDMI